MQRFPQTPPGLAGEISQTANQTASQQIAPVANSTVGIGTKNVLTNPINHLSAIGPMSFIILAGVALAFLVYKGHVNLAASVSGKVG